MKNLKPKPKSFTAYSVVKVDKECILCTKSIAKGWYNKHYGLCQNCHDKVALYATEIQIPFVDAVENVFKELTKKRMEQ